MTGTCLLRALYNSTVNNFFTKKKRAINKFVNVAARRFGWVILKFSIVDVWNKFALVCNYLLHHLPVLWSKESIALLTRFLDTEIVYFIKFKKKQQKFKKATRTSPWSRETFIFFKVRVSQFSWWGRGKGEGAGAERKLKENFSNFMLQGMPFS